MANITYFVVVPFTRDEDGMVVPGEAKEAPNGEAAQRRARAVAASTGNVGAVAFSRSGDPDSGELSNGAETFHAYSHTRIQANCSGEGNGDAAPGPW